MSGLDLKRLRQNKDEILKAEIGALLFNLGKTHIGFWKSKKDENGNEISYFSIDENSFKNIYGFEIFSNYKDYYNSPFEKELEKFSLKDFIFSQKVNLRYIGSEEINWIEFFKGGSSEKDFIKKIFFRGCENINSGIDKGVPKEQTKPPLWLSNAFGSFKKIIEENDFDEERQCFFQKLYDFLNTKNYLVNPDWVEIRNFILKEIKKWYSNLLSDSRFPINDVSLWDQAYMTASMFKAVLANLFLDNSNLSNYQPNPSTIRWRILGIQYDKLGLAEKGFKLASISWYRETVKEIDGKIKEMLEVEYPIGNEIYRDETGIYFIVGENLGKDNGDFAKLVDDLKEIKDKIINIFKQELKGEIYPVIVLTKASRGLMNLGFLLNKAKENFLKNENINYNTYDLNPSDPQKGKAIGICPLCKIRLIYEEDKQKNNSPTICEVCDDRIHHKQVEKWISNLGSETIWTSEIKDKNDRIALISLKFELKDWLNGNMLNTLVLQSNVDFNKDLLNLKKELINIFKNDQDKKVKETVLRNYTDNALYGLKIKSNKIIESILLERSIGHEWEDFIKTSLSDSNLINFEKREIQWKNLTDQDIEFLATILLQFLLRKNPSPARLRRIWETTQEFFENLKKEVLDNNALHIPDWRRKRVVFEVDYTDELKQNIKETGEELEGEGFLFWAQPSEDKSKVNIYLITSIKDFIEKFGIKELKERIFKNENFDISKESFESFNIKLRKYSERENKGEGNTILELTKDNIKEIQEYKLYASITDPTPIDWQVIIPAECVPKFIDLVTDKYDKEFKYVYGKLPIHIGIIVQDYKKPLYIGINALRKIQRDMKNTDNLYIQEKVSDFCIKLKKKLSYATEEERLNNTEAYYSLYWDNPNNKDYHFYIKPDKNWKKWISTLDKFGHNDKIYFIPNTFDFEFMDTNTRRNDIYYDTTNYKRILKLKSNRPYEIEEYWEKFKIFKEIFSDKASSSKLHKLISLIYEKIQDFDENYAYLLKSAFINILELNKNQDLRKGVCKILDIEDIDENNFERELIEKLKEKENLYLFLDMFEFGHKALKEV